ncbi:MAG: hypothetical protein RR379_08980, partial [Clostridia bacterium]
MRYIYSSKHSQVIGGGSIKKFSNKAVSEKKNLKLLYIIKGLFFLGNNMFSFAISFYILSHTNSSMQFTLSLMINYFPKVFASPLAGLLNDKIS